MGGEMKKATILGALALLVVVTALLAGPALSSSSSEQVTIKSLARQVNILKRQVNAMKKQVAATQRTTANLVACLHATVPVTRYGDYVGIDLPTAFVNAHDPDESFGVIPEAEGGIAHFGISTALDETATGDPVNYYFASVDPSCVGQGSFRMAEHAHAIPRR